MLSALGFSTIALPSGELRAGDEMPLRVCTPAQSAPDSVQWFYDGGSVGSESLVLTSGTHTLRAVLVRGGASEELTVELQVR